jgi:hypothetical protein
MQYPAYQEAGWPIGSGMVESANKLVVEARLKGAGRHWERRHVNPMLVLRNAVCNERWHETWQTGLTHRLAARSHRRQERTERRLRKAYWKILMALMRLHRLAAPTSASRTPPYSWRRPFLRRPPSSHTHHAKI